MKFHGNKRFAFGALAAICALALAFAVAPSSGGGVQDFAQSSFATVVKASAQNGDQDLDVAAYDDAVTRSGFEAGESAVADDATDREPDEVLYDDSGAAYENGVVLVRVPADKPVEQTVAALAEETGIDGLAIADGESLSVSDGSALVELSVPGSVGVEEAVTRIGAASSVDSVQPNYTYQLDSGESLPDSKADMAGTLALTTDGTLAHGLVAQATSVDDPYVGKQWGLQSIYAYGDTTGVGNAWDVAKAEHAVGVAVIDEGFIADHPDLKANVVVARNIHTGNNDVSETDGEGGHGTHVAGIIGAVANNGEGVAGVSYNAQLVLIKVADKYGSFTSAGLAKAIKYAASIKDKYNIRVINMSIGAPVSSTDEWKDDVLIDAIDYATAEGVVVVCSGGNETRDSAGKTWKPPYINYPSDYKNVVSVINLAHKDSDVHSVYRNANSNYNFPEVAASNMPSGKNISAPGTKIYSTCLRLGYNNLSGTSMAAPSVSGALALLFAAHPELSVSEAKSLLYSTATDIASGGAGWDAETGYGEVNAYRLVTKDGYLSGTPIVQAGKTINLTPSGSGSWTWKTSDAAIATVSGGTVTGVASGSVRISATRSTADGEETLHQVVTVYDPKIAGSSSVGIGVPERFSIDGSPAGAWRWTSSDEDAIKVNRNGVVTGLKMGAKATITASLADTPTISVTKTVKVGYADIARAKVSVEAQLYTGKACKPAPTVKLADKKLVRGKDYSVSYKNNVKVGRATVIIKGKGTYRGVAKSTFKIVRMPMCKGASKVPVDASATYVVKNGTIKLKSGIMRASLAGKTLTPLRTGTVVLAILDKAGIERATKKVKVYALTGTWELRSAVDSKYALDIANASKKNGANAQLYHRNGTSAQRFRFISKPNETYRIKCACSGKTLAVAKASKANGANVRQYKWNKTAAQRWRLEVDASNRVTLINKHSGRALSLANSKAADCVNVVQRTSKGAKYQKWILKKV